MVEFFPETTEGKIEWLRDNIPASEWQTKSGAQIQRELKAVGFELRTQDFYRAQREALSMVAHQQQIQLLRPESKVPENWITNTRVRDMSSNYSYQFEVQGTSTIDGTPMTQYLSISTNERLSIEQLDEAIMELCDELEDKYEFAADSASLFRVYGRPDRASSLLSA